MDIFILGFVIPFLVIFMARYLYAFYYPINLGIHCSDLTNHHPYVAGESAAKNFFIFNSLIFTISFVLFTLIIFLLTIYYLYSWPTLLVYVISIYKFLIISYLLWFSSLVAAGYIFGNGFYDALSYAKIRSTFYYINLDQSYGALIHSPNAFLNSFSLLLEDEQGVKKRIKLHGDMAKEYKKNGDIESSNCLEEAVELNKKKAIKMAEIRKKWGKFGIILHNIADHIGNIIFFPFAPALFLYVIIIDFFVSIFNVDETDKNVSASK